MATEHSTSNDLKNEIAYLEYQQYSINVNLESLRQELQGIDFFLLILATTTNTMWSLK